MKFTLRQGNYVTDVKVTEIPLPDFTQPKSQF